MSTYVETLSLTELENRKFFLENQLIIVNKLIEKKKKEDKEKKEKVKKRKDKIKIKIKVKKI